MERKGRTPMDARKLIENGGSEQEFEAAMHTLAETIREAGECMLDLQHAVELLRMANEPRMALAVDMETTACLRRAMQRTRS
jgi:hypothetical protein